MNPTTPDPSDPSASRQNTRRQSHRIRLAAPWAITPELLPSEGTLGDVPVTGATPRVKIRMERRFQTPTGVSDRTNLSILVEPLSELTEASLFCNDTRLVPRGSIEPTGWELPLACLDTSNRLVVEFLAQDLAQDEISDISNLPFGARWVACVYLLIEDGI